MDRGEGVRRIRARRSAHAMSNPSGAPPADDLATVRSIAALARLSLGDGEARVLAGQFARTLEHFQALARLDVTGVEPTTGAAGLADVTRPDEPRPFADTEALLARAPERDGDFYAVPKTVGGDE
jgi:aspartyl-tRNA(Asn)/glutamyl-tRNA(Gln) amidotransferase subunit C